MNIPSVFWLVPFASLVALGMAFFFFRKMMGEDEGTPRMKEIALYVRKGAMAYLWQQYKVVGIVFVVLCALFAFMAYGLNVQNPWVPFAFLTGGLFSGLAGFFGMKTATYASARTANALTNNDIKTVRDLVMLSDSDLKNLKGFLPLLDTLITDTYDKALWSEAMVSIDNKELLELWRKALVKPKVWLNLLASWGLSYDACMEFVAIAGREELYQTKDNSPLIVGKKYKVLSNAWILTSNEGKKSIIKKGIVVQTD